MSFWLNGRSVLVDSPSIRFSLPLNDSPSTPRTIMSSAQATGFLSPSPRSPLMNVNWGVRRHGLEEFPPMLGVDEFAVVNPDFWSGTPEEQRAFHGRYRFSDVSSFLLMFCYSC